jgi:hypothetical protein
MLAGLILRGIAFEYRYKTERLRWIWDVGFAGGSLVAAFIQGLTVGALVEELPITNGQYTGGEFGWFSPFAALCGVGLCLGYSLFGACWLVRKCEGDVREAAYRFIPYLAISLLAFLVVVFGYALAEIFGSSTDGSSGRIYLSSRRSVSSPRRGSRQRSAAPGWSTILYGRAHFRGVWHARDLVLALHDPVLDHDRRSGGATFQSRLHVLG